MEGGYYDEIRTTNLQALVEKKTYTSVFCQLLDKKESRCVQSQNGRYQGLRTSHFEAVNGNLKISWFPLRPKRYCITSSRRRSYGSNHFSHTHGLEDSQLSTHKYSNPKKKSTPKTNHPKKLMFWLRSKKIYWKSANIGFPPWTRPALHEWHDEWYLEDLRSRVVPGEGGPSNRMPGPTAICQWHSWWNRSKKYWKSKKNPETRGFPRHVWLETWRFFVTMLPKSNRLLFGQKHVTHA